MPYTLTYQVAFTNELLQACYINFSKLDGEAPASVTQYAAVNVKLSYNGEEGKFATLFGMSLEVEFNMQNGEPDCIADFVSATKYQWKAEVFIDDDEKPFFKGFILADEGAAPFQDRPYNAKVTAVDGIGLLKDEFLDKDVFIHHHSLISYISFCLQKTGLELPIRVYDNIYHSTMTDRMIDLRWDFISQTYLEYRTFLKNATTFTDCYNALEIMLKENFRLFQWNGQWVIIRLGLLQYNPDEKLYYTLYEFNGDNPTGFEETDNYAQVGKSQLIFPINENQDKYLKKPVKSTKTIYNYEIWPELPKNNKWERGTQFVGNTLAVDEIDADGDDDFTEAIGVAWNYLLDDWEWGEIDLWDPNLPVSVAAVAQAKVRKVINEFGLEIIREVAVFPSVNSLDRIASCIRSDAVPVVQGDKINFGVEMRFAPPQFNPGDDVWAAAIVYIVPAGGGDPYFLKSDLSVVKDNGKWVRASFADGESVFVFATGSDDSRKYGSADLKSYPIPTSGDLYIALLNFHTNRTNYFRNLRLEYFPMVAGGFQNVEGDFWEITQTTTYPDRSEREVFVSDNLHKVFKGCLLNSAGIPFTPDWHRYGVDESKHYNQITNYNRFNQEHRRIKMIEGTFKTLMYNAENNQEIYYPIGLHKQYRFMDFPTSQDIRFELAAPLEMDLIKCWVESRYWEIFDATEEFQDGQRPELGEFKYIF